MAKNYRDTFDDQWVRMPLVLAKHVACCDCGLTHKFKFRLSRGRLFMSVWRDDRETATVRKRFSRKLVCSLKRRPTPETKE